MKDNESVSTLEFLVKSYLINISIFYCREININDKELNNLINSLDDYIKTLIK